ncbi:DUF4058 family protein [Iningainema tapete]|uniref:DUF4058 family protein n=1 Tax=Iningainema tapete BLCC-T55 TaxID=2748662 RepID=A0A8J6XJ16_9CYAN|nr:DUF4058 family protein [Iningainema tapete]MBD2775388.1 DUF4058 family protein [Iningainema tapete BLCC-T55]
MPSPFPGMDPYLENPEFWAEVHHRLITAIAIALAPPLRPKYQVAIEKRTYLTTLEDTVLVGIPDTTIYSRQRGNLQPTTVETASTTQTIPVQVEVPMLEEVHEGYLEIRENATKQVITVVEILSPKNKRSGEGRIAYESKRRQILATATHFVEIDLLRSLPQMPILKYTGTSDYRILISRGDKRPVSDLYAFSVKDQIPAFHVPLQPLDTEPILDLQHLLNEVYDQAGYDLRIDYTQPSVPPLSEEKATWANILLSEKGFRNSTN